MSWKLQNSIKETIFVEKTIRWLELMEAAKKSFFSGLATKGVEISVWPRRRITFFEVLKIPPKNVDTELEGNGQAAPRIDENKNLWRWCSRTAPLPLVAATSTGTTEILVTLTVLIRIEFFPSFVLNNISSFCFYVSLSLAFTQNTLVFLASTSNKAELIFYFKSFTKLA